MYANFALLMQVLLFSRSSIRGCTPAGTELSARTMRYVQLYDGKFPPEAPDNINCYCTCNCGKKLYLIGAKYGVIWETPTQPIIVKIGRFIEFCHKTGETIEFDMVDDLPADVTDIYTLGTEDLVGVVFFDVDELETNPLKKTKMIQRILRLNREFKFAETVIERRISFDGIMNTRMGIGTSDTGYLMISGKTTAANGDVAVAMLIAANPSQIEKIPDVTLDKELAQLESICRLHALELYVLPNCVPLLNSFGIFFLLSKAKNNLLLFDPHHMAMMYRSKASKSWIIQVVDMDGLQIERAMMAAHGKILNINYMSMVTQKQNIAWISFIVPKPWDHWRNRLQVYLTRLCGFVIKYIGKPLIYFGRYDGGFMARWFTIIYSFLVGPNLIPNVSPAPDLFLVCLNLRNLTFRHVRTPNNEEKFRKGKAAIIIDSLKNGDALMTEIAPDFGHMRVGRLDNPFKMKALFELCYEHLDQVSPSLFSNRLKGICRNRVSGGGCSTLA